MNMIHYPLGKATIPWMIALNLGIGWSSGSFFTYVISLHFRASGVPLFLQRFYEYSLVNDQDDLAGLLCYTSTFSVFLILAVHQTLRYKHSLRLPLPKLRPTGIAFLKSTILVTPIWVCVGWFFEEHRYGLAGDGNWPAIAGLTGIASFHAFLFQSLMPYSD